MTCKELITKFVAGFPDDQKQAAELGVIAGYMAAMKEREWISVDRVSPPELVDLLVYIPDEEHIAAAIYERSEGFYENYDNKPIENPVSHWMLMPVKPPKIQP